MRGFFKTIRFVLSLLVVVYVVTLLARGPINSYLTTKVQSHLSQSLEVQVELEQLKWHTFPIFPIEVSAYGVQIDQIPQLGGVSVVLDEAIIRLNPFTLISQPTHLKQVKLHNLSVGATTASFSALGALWLGSLFDNFKGLNFLKEGFQAGKNTNDSTSSTREALLIEQIEVGSFALFLNQKKIIQSSNLFHQSSQASEQTPLFVASQLAKDAMSNLSGGEQSLLNDLIDQSLINQSIDPLLVETENFIKDFAKEGMKALDDLLQSTQKNAPTLNQVLDLFAPPKQTP